MQLLNCGPQYMWLLHSFFVKSVQPCSIQLLKQKKNGLRWLNIYIYLLTAIGLLPGGSGYFTCIQNMKLVTTKFKWGGLHEKHVVATWNLGNHLSICL